MIASVGTGAIIGVGTVAGDRDDDDYTRAHFERARDRYNSEGRAIEAVQRHAQPVLDLLEASEIIPKATPSIFRTGNGTLSEEDVQAGNTGVFVNRVMSSEDPEPTARITARYETEKYSVGVYVKPEQETSYAIIVSKSERDSATVITLDDVQDDDISTLDEVCPDCGGGGGCGYLTTNCTSSTSRSCHGVYDEYEIWECTNGECYWADRVGCCGSPNEPC